MLEAVAATLGVKKGEVVVAFIASIISLRFLPEIKTWYDKASAIATGFFCSAFVGPAITEVLDLKERTGYGVLFLVGVLGVSAMAALLTIVKSGELWAAIRKRYFGG